MNKEELGLLKKIESLPKELNIEIRGLILAQVCLREEIKKLKQQNEFLMKQDNILQALMQWLYEEVCVEKSSSSFKQPLIIVIEKIKELKEEMK